MTDRAKRLRVVPEDGFDVAVDMLTREQRRSRRHREVRKRTVSMVRMTKRELQLGAAEFPEAIEGRPCTRGECDQVPRPCPYVGCKWNLYIDVSPKNGAIILNFPDIEPDQMVESCALDVADRGGETLEDVGQIYNLTRERIRQVATRAEQKIAAALVPWEDRL